MTQVADTTESLVLGPQGTKGFGSVAMRLLQNGMNVNSLRTNDVLHKEEWLLFDRTVIDISRAQLVGVKDLLAVPNLRFPVADAMGITMVQHEKASDMSDASVDMTGMAGAEKDRQSFTLVNIPLPIIHKDFSMSLRALTAGSRQGTPVDTSQAAVASRREVDAMESMLFKGVAISATGLTGGSGTIYGYTNFPDRTTGSVTAAWSTATGAQILTDTVRLIGDAQNKNHFGPYNLYVPVAVYVHLLDDLKAQVATSILTRLLEIPNITSVKGTSQLTSSNIVLVQMLSDTVDWIDGIQPTTVMWETGGGLMVHFKVLAIGAPRVKSDSSSQSGVVHYS